MVMNAGGSHLTALTSGSLGTVGHPTWSPDGTQIAFEDHGIFGFAARISVINSDGTANSQLPEKRNTRTDVREEAGSAPGGRGPRFAVIVRRPLFGSGCPIFYFHLHDSFPPDLTVLAAGAMKRNGPQTAEAQRGKGRRPDWTPSPHIQVNSEKFMGLP
jgi:hypothetical protein